MNRRLHRLFRFGRVSRALGLPLAMMLVGPGQALAQSASAAVDSSAEVVVALSCIKLQDLYFGTIIPSAAKGSILLDPINPPVTTGGVRLASGTLPRPAVFAGRGAVNQQVYVKMARITALNRIGGGASMTMDTFKFGNSSTVQFAATRVSFVITDPDGRFEFPVGAALRVNPNQAPGTYTGTFGITLQYE